MLGFATESVRIRKIPDLNLGISLIQSAGLLQKKRHNQTGDTP